jgi:hypothetical protein
MAISRLFPPSVPGVSRAFTLATSSFLVLDLHFLLLLVVPCIVLAIWELGS